MPSSVNSTKKKRLTAVSLAAYADFLLKNHFDDFVNEYFSQAIARKIPLSKFLDDLSEKDLRDLVKKNTREFLTFLSDNQKQAYIELALNRWASGMGVLDRDPISIDDIIASENIRKQIFLNFLPRYVSNVDDFARMVKDLDGYLLSLTSAVFKSYVKMLDDRINEQVDAIQKVNHTFRQAEAITHIGTYQWDLQSHALLWSDELYRIYGLSPGSVDLSNSEVVRSFNHPDDDPIVTRHINEAIDTLKPFDFTYRIILQDGAVKKLHARGEVLCGEDGRARTIIGTAQDVTEKDRLIHRLQESQKLFDQAQALAHLGNWEWDIERNSVHWTDELYRIYGIAPQSLAITLQSFIERVHPEDVDHVMEQTRQTIEHKRGGNFFHRIVLDDGSIKILHAKSEAIVNDLGTVIKIIGTTQDVTSEKLLEKKLRENQVFIEKIANATPSLIASYNVNTGRYVFVSAGLKKLLGYEPAEALEKGVSFFAEKIHPDDVAELMQKNAAALDAANNHATTGDNEHEPIIEFRYRLRHANGTYRWLNTFGTVFDRNAKNQVEHVLNISLDITESVKAAEVLEQKSLELQQSNANLEEFAFVASHDLKEPLHKIITYVDRLALREKQNVSEEGRAMLEKIMSSSVRMQQMISDLLSLSVISADKTFSKVNLRKLVDEVLMTFDHKIEERKAQIKISDLPEANVVPSQFRQLFQNLISNSLKFSKQNVPPVLTITHRLLQPSDIVDSDSSMQKSDQYLEIEFRDNGIGFDNAYVEKIFSVFQRLHQRETYEGTGIGLSICKKVVENHGGKIAASGRPSEGALFTIVIPYY